MYEKLGDLLNETLESGKIPEVIQEEPAKSDINKDRDTSSSDCDKSGLFSFNSKSYKKERKKVKIPENTTENTAEVTKMHKYTEIMHIPLVIQQALSTLDIAYPYNTLQLNKAYRKQLKLHHPDKKITIQNQETVLNNRQLSIDEITEAYKLLKDYLNSVK